MAEDKLERIYIVNLSKAYTHTRNTRASWAVKILRTYLARHFKVEEENVRISASVNASIWRDSMQKPPRKIKVRGIKQGESLQVSLADEKPPKAKKEKKPKAAQKPAEKKTAAPAAGAKPAETKKEAAPAKTEAPKTEPKKA